MAKSFTFRASAAEILGVVSRVTRTNKNAVEVLNGVHLALEGKELIVQGSDMSLILRERLPVTHVGEGTRVVLKADKVLKGLRTLDGIVTFAGRKNVLAIRNGTTTLNYALGNVEDYPTLPVGPTDSAVSCERKEFELTFGTVKAALGKDQSRPILCCVKLEMDPEWKGRFRMTATDSYRLASDSCASTQAEFGEANVDGQDFAKALQFVGHGLAKKVTLSRFDKWVVLSEGERSAWLRVIEGQFPNYRQLLPQSWEACIELNRREALKAFDRMSKLNEYNRPAKITWAADAVLATIGSDIPDVNLVESRIEATATGAYELGLPYGINPTFMYDALQSIGGEKVRFHYINPLRPCLITEPDWNHEGGGMPDRFYLVMPIRLP
jgi:DNA polymerase-3 subunit beta